MTPQVRRALIWSGLFLFALAGGSWLGSFTIGSGLIGSASFSGAADAQNFRAAQDQAHESRAEPPPAPPVERFVRGIPESHVCEGCDTHLVRDRELNRYLDSEYGPPLGEAPDAGEALPQ